MLQKFGDIVTSLTSTQIQKQKYKDFIYKLFRSSLKDLQLEHLNSFIEVKSFKDGILTITSAEGIWVQEIYLRQNKIKQFMNTKIQGDKLKSIKVAVVPR